LDNLVLSPTYVRKTPSSAAEDDELEASIRGSGLKQNLVVHPIGDARDAHAVVAGGRRLKVLQKLAAEGALPAGFKVPYQVEEPEAALETSLIENTIPSAVHPVDEFVARASLIDCRRGDRGDCRSVRRLRTPCAPAPRRSRGNGRGRVDRGADARKPCSSRNAATSSARRPKASRSTATRTGPT